MLDAEPRAGVRRQGRAHRAASVAFVRRTRRKREAAEAAQHAQHNMAHLEQGPLDAFGQLPRLFLAAQLSRPERLPVHLHHARAQHLSPDTQRRAHADLIRRTSASFPHSGAAFLPRWNNDHARSGRMAQRAQRVQAAGERCAGGRAAPIARHATPPRRTVPATQHNQWHRARHATQEGAPIAHHATPPRRTVPSRMRSCTSTSQYLSASKPQRSFSRSHTSRSATDCTRPARAAPQSRTRACATGPQRQRRPRVLWSPRAAEGMPAFAAGLLAAASASAGCRRAARMVQRVWRERSFPLRRREAALLRGVVRWRTCRLGARKLAPEQRGEREAQEVVERATRQVGVHQRRRHLPPPGSARGTRPDGCLILLRVDDGSGPAAPRRGRSVWSSSTQGKGTGARCPNRSPPPHPDRPARSPSRV